VDPLAALVPSLNPYHYVRNNPINRIDPFGLTDKEDDDKNLPFFEANFVIECVAERNQEEGYAWNGTGYFLTDESLRDMYNEIRENRRSPINKIFEAVNSMLSVYNPAAVLDDDDVGGIIEAGQSVAELTIQLTKYYNKGKGVAVKLPNIKSFILALAIVIASDPATNLIGPDMNSVLKTGDSGVDTLYHDVGVQRTIKTIQYNFPDTSIYIDYNF
jgi:hypothetical protein